eukprot:CAMPEP_0179314294 /NCGR_PEP_ID=MMETSP0797-20121207/54349_1 /TAXON_ID=47934 /ORGANISM="Dinophysis acuminata, Strain DAEP01" /LENGTH=285 /DNA_ID=CAMNT_0021024537 /DNA_START=60 /DNA_END=913 /DNA_ORIENTATION=+
MGTALALALACLAWGRCGSGAAGGQPPHPAAGSAGGGLGDADPSATSPWPWTRNCNIPRLPLPPDGGLKDLPVGDAPYIATLPAGHNMEAFAKLSREALLEGMGDVTCTPSGAGSNRKGYSEMRLREYMEDWMRRELSRDPRENKYVFGEFGEQWEPLRESYSVPPCRKCAPEDVAITIGLGGLHSGAPWHFHNGGFIEMLHGRKHFAALPAGDPAIPAIDAAILNISMLHWHLEERPGMEAAGALGSLQECVIERGEVLYFPDRWHHGIVNLDPYTAFVSTFLP